MSFIGVIVIDILIHAVIFKQSWNNSSEFWLPSDQMNKLVPLAWLFLLIIIKLKGFIYVRFLDHNLKSGLMFGLLIGAASAIGVFGLMTIVPWPKTMILGMALQQFLGDILIGIIFGKFYQTINT